MKFFIPATDSKNYEATHAELITRSSAATGWKVSSRQIYSVNCVYEGLVTVATVGKKFGYDGVVHAILEADEGTILFTEKRGILSGEPIHLGKGGMIKDFDD
ncbi:MAG: hypothetical protein H7301_09140 [Cryobacterium sp.]|nr:hypothetical protein [Oligoflexia bacterium]